MPVPSLITDLSTTAASNFPAGTDSPSTLDDVQRAHGAFIAQLRTGAVATTANITAGTITGITPLGATVGGTGQSAYAIGDLLYAPTTTTVGKLADVATGNALISGGVGVAPSYGKVGLTTHVSGTLAAGNGGTGQTTYAVGDLLYAPTISTVGKLADVATGNALISGGVGVAPSYGKIGLTTHVSGTLPVANGGTGATTTAAAPFALKGANTDITSLGAVASINGGQLAGLRNRIINGNFGINQRVYVSGAAVGAGLYGHDRWKMAASADTYTFSTTANVTTVTIPSGKVLQQVIEGLNLETGTYVLSWTGTAQGKIGAGAYGASGITGAITGGTNTTIEFGPGTVSKVQLEIGVTPTVFEQRPYGMELSLCQYYSRPMPLVRFVGWIGSSGAVLHTISYPTMRSAPSAATALTYSGSGYTSTSAAVIKIDCISIQVNQSGAAQQYDVSVTAGYLSSEL